MGPVRSALSQSWRLLVRFGIPDSSRDGFGTIETAVKVGVLRCCLFLPSALLGDVFDRVPAVAVAIHYPFLPLNVLYSQSNFEEFFVVSAADDFSLFERDPSAWGSFCL